MGGKSYAFYILSILWKKLISKEIGQDVETLEFVKSYPYEKKGMLMLGYKAKVRKKELREGSIGWQLVKFVIENE